MVLPQQKVSVNKLASVQVPLLLLVAFVSVVVKICQEYQRMEAPDHAAELVAAGLTNETHLGCPCAFPFIIPGNAEAYTSCTVDGFGVEDAQPWCVVEPSCGARVDAHHYDYDSIGDHINDQTIYWDNCGPAPVLSFLGRWQGVLALVGILGAKVNASLTQLKDGRMRVQTKITEMAYTKAAGSDEALLCGAVRWYTARSALHQ
jgi:hypothetical protein